MTAFEPEHLARLVELADDLICVGNADGRFVRVNPSWSRVLGYDEATLFERPFVSFIHPDDVADTEREIRRVLRGRRLRRFTNRMRHADGHYVRLRWSVAPATGSQFAYAIARDVTSSFEVAARLEEQTRVLITTQARLAAEIARARDVQSVFFPGASLTSGPIRVAGRCVATEEMSGDFFDWAAREDGSVSLTIGDVMGKGFSAALLMATTMAALRRGDRARDADINPAGELDEANRTLADYLARSCRFVTAFRASVSPGGELRYADAGHGHAIVRRADGRFEELAGADGLPLGVRPELGYESARAQLEAGDALIVATDGLRDVLDSVGPEGWEHHINRGVSDWSDADAIADDIVLWAESATAGLGAADDLTVLVAVFEGARAERWTRTFEVEPRLSTLASTEAAVARDLETHDAGPDDRDRFVLALHEVLTNVITHAGPRSPVRLSVTFEVAPDERRVRADVEDDGQRFEGWASGAPFAGSRGGSGGRGLALCRDLLDEFEYDTRPTGNHWLLGMRLGLALQPDVEPHANGRPNMETSNERVIVETVAGRLDVTTAAEVADRLRARLADGPARIVLRLVDLAFIDSSGLGMLVGLQKELASSGGRLLLCEVPPQARMALRLTRLEWLLPCLDTLDEALAA